MTRKERIPDRKGVVAWSGVGRKTAAPSNENPQVQALIWPLQTHIWLNLNQCKIQLMVNVLDSGFILDPTVELHSDPLPVGENVGIGNNEPVLRHYEPRATGCRNSLTAQR